MDGGSKPKSIAVIGAGPKAAALAAKAEVLRRCEIANLTVHVFERTELAAHWKGNAGFTDGKGTNVTPPEKDVGFPYNSRFGLAVDREMMSAYSWASFMVSETSYANWVDLGRPRPRHDVWGRYIDWVIQRTSAVMHYETVASIGRAFAQSNSLVVNSHGRNGEPKDEEVDGVVFTGPGPIRGLKGNGLVGTSDDIDARSYWAVIDKFKQIPSGKVAIIGGGETAASVAISLLDNNPRLAIEIINRSGMLFSRGDSFFENQLFSSEGDWADRSLKNRAELIKRTDRGFVSAKAMSRLSEGKIRIRSGEVERVERRGNEITVRFEGAVDDVSYDSVINAMGFDNWAPLDLLAPELRPRGAHGGLTEDEQNALNIDRNLRLPSSDQNVNIHVPMISGVSQGPGFPGLSSLGLLADRILGAYVDK